MQLNNWKIYNKAGSPLNWYADSFINLKFSSDASSAEADGYLISDPSGVIVDSEITNSGLPIQFDEETKKLEFRDGLTVDSNGGKDAHQMKGWVWCKKYNLEC